MTVTDPIADFLTRIRNASKAQHRFVEIPFSKMKESLTQLLQEAGFIASFRLIDEDKPQKKIRIYLRYSKERISVIHGLKRISKPGGRYYVRGDSIPYVMRGLGIALLSTSKGILNDKQARRENVGGELLCYVW